MTSILPGTSGAQPPFDPKALAPPLTAAQVQTMFDWIQAVVSVHGGTLITAQQWEAEPDAEKISTYTAIYEFYGFTTTGITGPTAGIPNPLASVEQFLTILTEKQLWIRVAEFVVGGVVLAIGVTHLFGGSVSGAARKAANPVGTVAGAI